MKTISFIAFATFLTACDIMVVDTDYELELLDGAYQIEEYSQTFNKHFYYTVWISKSDHGTRMIYIDNFYDQDVTVRAEVIGHKLYVRRQYVDGYEIEGVGTLFGNRIQLDYSVTDMYSHKPTDFCEATLYW